MTNYTIKHNTEFNSIEIYFNDFPEKNIRETLKSLKFRWHGVKKCWYGYLSEEETIKALNGEKPEKKPAKKAAKKQPKKKAVNKYGVKVGDVFEASWGYDQTNLDYFQVVEIVGESMVRIVEVSPSYSVDWAGPMCENRKIQKFNGKMLPRAESSWCIEDQLNGDLHKVKNWGTEENPHPAIKVTSDGVITATKTEGDNVRYCSWYA